MSKPVRVALPRQSSTPTSLLGRLSVTSGDLHGKAGLPIPITCTLKDLDGQPLNGAHVTARARQGGDEISVGAATSDGDGRYSVAFTPPRPGRWHVRIEARDQRAGDEVTVRVIASPFGS